MISGEILRVGCGSKGGEDETQGGCKDHDAKISIILRGCVGASGPGCLAECVGNEREGSQDGSEAPRRAK